MMGADFYQNDEQARTVDPSAPPIGIGEGSIVEGAIIDKNCRIGKNVVVRSPSPNPPDGRCGPVVVRDGVIVIPKNTILPDGWKMGVIEPCQF